jgi:hypothetical protein
VSGDGLKCVLSLLATQIADEGVEMIKAQVQQRALAIIDCRYEKQ